MSKATKQSRLVPDVQSEEIAVSGKLISLFVFTVSTPCTHQCHNHVLLKDIHVQIGRKIVDVTFGPSGQKRTRREFVEGEQSADSEVAFTEGDLSSEGNQTKNQLSAIQEHLSNPQTPRKRSAVGVASLLEKQSRIDTGFKTGQTQTKAGNSDQANSTLVFQGPTPPSRIIDRETQQENTPNNATLEQHPAFLDTTVNDQQVLQTRQHSVYATPLPGKDSPNDHDSLNLEALDYLASNPFNLDLLTGNSLSSPTITSEGLNRVMHSFPPVTPGSSTGSSLDLYMAFYHDAAFKDIHSQLHDQMVRTARNLALTRQEPADVFSSTPTKTPWQLCAAWADESDTGSSTLGGRNWSVNLQITEDRYIQLWQNYLDEIAPWLDLFDNKNHWRTTVAHMAQSVECLQYALLALSSRQQERKTPGSSSTESLNLYQEAIRSIMTQLPALSTESIAACVLLCVFEMMSTSLRVWGKHLDGCSILLEAAGINGVVGGVEESLFWTFARMDVYRAFIGDTITTPPTNRWFISADSMSAAVRIFKSKPGSDSYANYVVFLCAGVMNILSNKGSSWRLFDQSSQTTFVSRWKAIYDLHQSWYKDRPEEMRPLMYVPASKTESQSPFSTILYSTPVGMNSNIMYHASIILLLQDKPKDIVLPKSHKSQLWHARQVWGIALSNNDHGALIHGLQPMWIAGRLMSHHSEHKTILDFLKHLEEQTGWGTSWRAKDLRDFWGISDTEI